MNTNPRVQLIRVIPQIELAALFCALPKDELAAMFCDRKVRHTLIAQAAYFRAEHRGFAPGHELEDWLIAEAEVDAQLAL